jgi:hypothetical protein
VPLAPSPTPTPVLSSDLGRAIENAVLACREKDAATLRSLVAGDVTQQQIDALFALGRDVVLKSQTPSINGNAASVTVELQITRTTGFENVQRTWRLTQGPDGLWRFDALPDCY